MGGTGLPPENYGLTRRRREIYLEGKKEWEIQIGHSSTLGPAQSTQKVRQSLKSRSCLLINVAEVGLHEGLPFWMIRANEGLKIRETTFYERLLMYDRIGYNKAKDLRPEVIGSTFELSIFKLILFWLPRKYLWKTLMSFAQHPVFRHMTANIFSTWHAFSISCEVGGYDMNHFFTDTTSLLVPLFLLTGCGPTSRYSCENAR
jgi:hypothetical protein